MGKELGKRLGGEGGLEGRGKGLFWRGGSAMGIFWFGGVLAAPFGGSKSPLRRLSIGLVTALSRFCRGEGNGGALFFPSSFEREHALAVAERRFHFKAVGQVPHFSDASVFEQDFHNVEANFDGRIVDGVKIVQRGHAE